MKKKSTDGKKHIPMISRTAPLIAIAGLSMVLMTGCTPEAFNIGQAAEAGPETVSDAVIYSSYNYVPVGTYDSADTAILKTISEEDHTVTLYNTVAARTYTLNYDGTTYASDKYGTTMSMAQMTEGTIVNVNFYKATKQLVNIQVSPDAWTYEDVSRFDLGGINSTATIGDRTYALTKGVQVFSEGRQTDLMNIVDGDSITVSGIGYDIYSIKVNSGHGYVRLSHDEALVGGWVEVGGTLITQINEPGMLLTVPEGTYTVRMYNNNSSVTQEITVERNQEIILDCSGVTAPEETTGRIIFHLTPETATLTMDGAVKDTSGIITAEYGVHEIVVSAPGYDTLSRYVNVSNELSEISIILDETKTYISDNSNGSLWNSLFGNTASGNSASANSASKNSSSSNSSSANTTSGNKKTVTAGGYNRVYIYYPDEVEVYVDGVYAGLTPMSFRKTAGSHTIILKKAGYETRSYTVYLYDDKEDMSISFSELEPVNTGSTGQTSNTSATSSSSSSSSGTGNSGSTNTGTDSSGSSGSSGTDNSGSSSGTDSSDTAGNTSAGDNNGTTSGTDAGNTGSGNDTSGSGASSGNESTGDGNDSSSSSSTDSSNDTESGQHNTENP